MLHSVDNTIILPSNSPETVRAITMAYPELIRSEAFAMWACAHVDIALHSSDYRDPCSEALPGYDVVRSDNLPDHCRNCGKAAGYRMMFSHVPYCAACDVPDYRTEYRPALDYAITFSGLRC